MKKLIGGGLAALAVGAGLAAPAQADPYTQADMDFISYVSSIGYYDNRDALIATGHQICDLLRNGADSTGLRPIIIARHGDGDYVDDANFNAAIFVHNAAAVYCPEQPEGQGEF